MITHPKNNLTLGKTRTEQNRERYTRDSPCGEFFDIVVCSPPTLKLRRDAQFCKQNWRARIAQLVEHSTDTRKVLGSTPSARTTSLRKRSFAVQAPQCQIYW